MTINSLAPGDVNEIFNKQFSRGRGTPDAIFVDGQLQEEYCKTSKFKIMHTKSQNLNVSRLVLQLSLPSPLKPGVKSRMKM